METPPTTQYPERMNAFMTTEHFTLQSARSIINAEIMSRVNIYFVTLSSVLIASGFLAQVPQMAYLFRLFAWIAFPVMILHGVFTMARLMVLGHRDFTYIRAINRIRQFYLRAAPEVEKYLLFPPYDDDLSTRAYGGYSNSFRGNLLSAANAVNVTNSVLATVLVSVLFNLSAGFSTVGFLPYALGLFVLIFALHGLLCFRLASIDLRRRDGEVQFPAPQPEPQPGKAS